MTPALETSDFITDAQIDAYITSVKSKRDAVEVSCEEMKSMGGKSKDKRIYRRWGAGDVYLLTKRETVLRDQEVMIANMLTEEKKIAAMKQK